MNRALRRCFLSVLSGDRQGDREVAQRNVRVGNNLAGPGQAVTVSELPCVLNNLVLVASTSGGIERDADVGIRKAGGKRKIGLRCPPQQARTSGQ